MPGWKLTVRHGSEVGHASFDDLGEAVAALRERAMAIRSQGPVKRASGFRDYEPGEHVRARLQLSGGGPLRKRVAGVDVRGDGTFVPYRGGVRREELATGETAPFEAVRDTLAEG